MTSKTPSDAQGPLRHTPRMPGDCRDPPKVLRRPQDLLDTPKDPLHISPCQRQPPTCPVTSQHPPMTPCIWGSLEKHPPARTPPASTPPGPPQVPSPHPSPSPWHRRGRPAPGCCWGEDAVEDIGIALGGMTRGSVARREPHKVLGAGPASGLPLRGDQEVPVNPSEGGGRLQGASHTALIPSYPSAPPNPTHPLPSHTLPHTPHPPTALYVLKHPHPPFPILPPSHTVRAGPPALGHLAAGDGWGSQAQQRAAGGGGSQQHPLGWSGILKATGHTEVHGHSWDAPTRAEGSG